MVVVDTSAIVEYLLGIEYGEWVAARLDGEDEVHAPHVIDVEVFGVVRRLVGMGRLSPQRAEAALTGLVDLRLVRYAHVPLLGRMWQLRENVSPRDAAFVSLAELLGAELVTTDGRLARAPGIRATVLTP